MHATLSVQLGVEVRSRLKLNTYWTQLSGRLAAKTASSRNAALRPAQLIISNLDFGSKDIDVGLRCLGLPITD